jgi:hypothetical protein
VTGILQAVAAGSSQFQSPQVTLLDVKAGAQASCSITLVPDGTITLTGSGSTCVPASWYLPTTAAIGASYWCKCVVNSGSAPGSPNTVLPLTAGQAYGIVRSGSAGTTTGNWTISILGDAGGTLLLSSFTFTATATWT